MTTELNLWFASLPAGTVVDLPSDGCYLVSNSSSSLLAIENTSRLTINGEGATFEQGSYSNGGNNDPGPILTLGFDRDLTIKNITVRGPSSAGGSEDEGDTGILMWQNTVVNLDGVTITTVEGDGLDLYPLGNEPGVNWNVTMDDSTIENIGYHAIVPEAVNGFTFEGSTLSSGDIDAEVDFSCQSTWPFGCGRLNNPDIGVVNMAFRADSFPNGMTLEDGMSCMPVGNWTIEGNSFGGGGIDLQLDTTYSLTLSALDICGQYSGLTIENNTSTNGALTPCCGSGSPYILLQGWSNVTIADNHLVFDVNQGLVGGPVMDLWGDRNVAITNNTFANYYTVAQSDAPSGWPATTDVLVCGNTIGSEEYPVTETACPSTAAGSLFERPRFTAIASEQPASETPEAPAAILLPVTAGVILAGGATLVVRRRRKMESTDSG